MTKTLSIVAEKEGEIRDLLRKYISYSQLSLLKKSGTLLCNGVPVNTRFRLQKGDVLQLSFYEEATIYPPKELDLEIRYEDEDYLVVDKGCDIACIPNQRGMDNIFEGLAFLRPNVPFHVLTRLDKDTSGLVLLAKSSLAASASPAIRKFYLALVEGEVAETLLIDEPIARGEDIRRVVSPEGKPSVTIVTPLSRQGNNTLVECELLTGRTHQIRVHLSHVGHPIVGDTLYGNGVGEYNSGQKLLCARIEFIQPFTKEPIVVKSNKKIGTE